MLTSARRGIIYPNTNRTDSADVPRDIAALVAALEIDVIYGQGTLAARPTSTGGSPGIQGRIYQASDQSPKQFFWDNGTGWDAIGAITASIVNQQGLLTNRPAANSVGAGTTYFATDQVVLYISDGFAWARMSPPAGTSVNWFKPDAAVPAGWVKYDGTNLPSNTGIYADLYAHLGNTTTTPDTRGRATVGLGAHADHDAVGDADGVAVGSRRMRHKHTVTDPGHTHNIYDGYNVRIYNTGANTLNATSDTGGNNGYQVNDRSTVNSAVTGITVGPQTGAEPTDSPAFITCVKLAKL